MKLVYQNIHTYSQAQYDQFYTMIKKEKQEKISNLLRKEDQYRSILGEILLMTLLNEMGINYDHIHISRNIYDRPYISDLDIFFSIAHSHEYVVCAISKKEIGVDIEKIRHVEHSVIKQFATLNEQDYIHEISNIYDQRCFDIYTLKESYFKCLGIDLSMILDIEFSISKNFIKCSDTRYRFQLLNDIPGYCIALCERD